MPTYNYPFSGGVTAVAGWGDRWRVQFAGTWTVGTDGSAIEFWTIQLTGDLGDITVGVGNLAALTPTVCMTDRDRVYLGMQSQFNFSDNDDPTRWEEQDPGAGFVQYLTQYGYQDLIMALGQLQGRLAVLARRSIQIWTVDSDPSNFALVQTLDNVGCTLAPLSVQQLGDFDLLFLDDTGVRSLRTREVTLNSYVDDVGSAIDELVRQDLTEVIGTSSCAIVEPTTKHYWLYLNNQIYVLSRHQSVKISAWSRYIPTDQLGVSFTPQKFVVFNGQVFCRSVEFGHFVYGGSNNTTYDASTVVTVQLPWLHDKKPDTLKQATAIEAVIEGSWLIQVSMDPQSNNFVTCVPQRGSPTTPNALTDSTYDLGNYRIPGLKGTHFSLQLVNTPVLTDAPAVISSLVFHYNDAGKA